MVRGVGQYVYMGMGGGPSARMRELGNFSRLLLENCGLVASLLYSWGWNVLIVDQVFLACLCNITLMGSMLVSLWSCSVDGLCFIFLLRMKRSEAF